MERPDLPLPEVSKARAAERATSLAAHLDRRFRGAGAHEVIEAAVETLFRGRVTMVSSFGADSAVLLHLLSEVDASVPVTFIDTGQLFQETLDYRDALVERLKLADVRTVTPDAERLKRLDPENFLWQSEPNLCCRIRKVAPLAEALADFPAWISGRKRFQNATRAELPVFEADGARIKINPLAEWSAKDVKDYATVHGLPEHPLVRHGFLSIGCMPCTSRVKPGEDARAGRWRGLEKTECGIHTAALENEGSGI
ncbi:phosphoadenylyl-sulfate reductase [Chenggangzhangella methanolivorans]|uniref:Adenosine 5'-phosphosulfate reductase n=1 Tax=Chenggangzhangella methanolivorans TaxID=1437009 RepID=A0A9E6UMA5_9HYPH|nr:phosphoadenylyl-sulfate reductase [Chenggangzhangella methanolivorans]QZO01472.1 phosphoadenylyl-sulfate reductase [Chenggangzhangella methanolivorans]